jgi:hypothetical protein
MAAPSFVLASHIENAGLGGPIGIEDAKSKSPEAFVHSPAQRGRARGCVTSSPMEIAEG